MQQVQRTQLTELAEIAKSTVLHGQSVERRLGLMESNLTQLLKDVSEHDTMLNEISTKVTNLELDYEITDEQNKVLRSRVMTRVRKFCEYPSVYFQTYIRDCYGFLKKNYNCGSSIARTKKRNYDYVMQGIDAWHPDKKAIEERKNKIDLDKRMQEQKIDGMAKTMLDQDTESAI